MKRGCSGFWLLLDFTFTLMLWHLPAALIVFSKENESLCAPAGSVVKHMHKLCLPSNAVQTRKWLVSLMIFMHTGSSKGRCACMTALIQNWANMHNSCTLRRERGELTFCVHLFGWRNPFSVTGGHRISIDFY